MGFPLLHGRRRLPGRLLELLRLLLERRLRRLPVLVLLPHPLERLLEPKLPRLARQRKLERLPGRWLRSRKTAQRPVQRTNGYS
jgi:hypothetical protein